MRLKKKNGCNPSSLSCSICLYLHQAYHRDPSQSGKSSEGKKRNAPMDMIYVRESLKT